MCKFEVRNFSKMDFLNKTEERLIKVMRELPKQEQKKLETFAISLKPKSKIVRTKKSKQTIDPIEKWRGYFKGKCSTSEEFAKRKADEKLLEE